LGPESGRRSKSKLPARGADACSPGQLLKKLDDLGIADNTIVIYTTDNGPYMNAWPDAAHDAVPERTEYELGSAFRLPAIIRWPGKIKPGTVSNEIFSGLDWFPAAAVGQLDIKHNLLNGYTVGSKTYKNHLDRYRLRTPVLKEAKAFLYELNLPSEPSRR
jgi:arylsulfatase A-like enzyme